LVILTRAYRILLGILTNKKRPLRSSREPERLSTLFLFSTSTHKSTVVMNRTLRSFLFVTLVTKSICLCLECFGKINSLGIYLLQNNRARHFYISFLLVTSVASSFDFSTRPFFYVVLSSFWIGYYSWLYGFSIYCSPGT